MLLVDLEKVLMQKITQTVNNYVQGLSEFKNGKEYKVGTTSYRLKFDPSSFDQVLLFFSKENGRDSIQFACTEFGIYIREEEVEHPSHYFYHTLMYTQDFGFTLNDLANVHYIFQEMKKS